MKWWMDNRLRMVQANLRDIDIFMDVDKAVEEWKSFCCNTVMVGASGITSSFPTKLECGTENPLQHRDLLGEIVEKCHREGIRVIARFDFSKTHIRHFQAHPDWYYRDGEGNAVFYHDTVQTCINGSYQQECSLQLIQEVLDRCPVDGIFFNMFGYTTRDYSGVYHGICQCENCRRRFKEATGLVLPKREAADEPGLDRYRQFQRETVRELLDKIRAVVDAYGRDVAVCTYTTHSVDMVRNESNSAVDRPLPFWLYSASENCQQIVDGYPDKISSNCAINAVDIFYRFQGVSPWLTQARLYQNIASGSGLDWCLIGVFEDYPDRLGWKAAREVFRFHALHEQYYGHFSSLARMVLIRPDEGENCQKEYRGLYRIFKERHLLFDVLPRECLEANPERLNPYELAIFPGLPRLSENVLRYLENASLKLAATDDFLEKMPEGLRWLEKLFGVQELLPAPSIRSWYAETEPKVVFPSFVERDWIFLDQPLHYLRTAEGNQNWLPLVDPAAYGPPERCFGHRKTLFPGFTVTADGKRLYAAFSPGSLYERYGYEDHKQVFLDALSPMLPSPPAEIDAPECVETFLHALPDGRWILQFINHSGFNGSTFFAPRTVEGIRIKLPQTPDQILELTPSGEQTHSFQKDWTLQLNGLYRTFVLRFPASH